MSKSPSSQSKAFGQEAEMAGTAKKCQRVSDNMLDINRQNGTPAGNFM